MLDTRSLPPVGIECPEQSRGDGSGLTASLPISAPHTLDPECVIGLEPLWESMERCLKGVRWKGSVASFYANAPTNIARLCDELHDGTYVPRTPKEFTVTSPKRREIVGISFRDRVYQRSLNDNVVYPLMSRSWIYDNCACQKGKGPDFAVGRLRRHLERCVRLHGDAYVLKADVAGYYPNMRHDVAESVFERRLPDWAFDMALGVLRTQYPGDVGYNPGSQIVQIAGVSVLDELDHVLKERMRADSYVRYMDDMIVISHDRGFLLDCMDCMAGYLAGIGFELNRKKTFVRDARKPIRFCGFYFKVACGKVMSYVDPDSCKRMRRRVGRLATLEAKGERPPGTTRQSYEGWRAHASRGTSKGAVKNADKWFAQIERGLLC